MYIYRDSYNLETGNISIGGSTIRLLGINWGFITDRAEISEETTIATGMVEDEAPNTVKYIRVSTGMNGVVPAWHLAKLLNSGQVKREREAVAAQERALAPTNPAFPSVPTV
ncbi:hypothetical protein [Bradyrhizobium sp. Ai1a-2]|uniref:hypothetical protein n=1 Tax=Bradyrhizobium sp. Ai1a-2 TaxID=196490 RepID=UPI0004163469|nr:hypothetical protein [Bradyrhizobium sp. Ai1a-2]